MKRQKNSSCFLEREANLKRGNSKDWADLVANQGYGDVWDLATAKVHVWVHKYAAALICVDVHSS